MGKHPQMDELMNSLNKASKEVEITRGMADYSDIKRIPNTSPRMNYCTHGGLPVGKLIEYYGEEHGGKTTTALDNVANFQALERKKSEEDPNYVDKAVLYCDVENRIDVEWAMKLGVDIDEMYLFQPKCKSAEEIFQVILDAIDKGEIGLVVIDSLGVMLSKQALEKTIADKTYGGIAMTLTNFCDRVVGLASKKHCTIIGINQVREDLNSMWGGYKTPGGKAWKHACSVRIQFSRGKFIDSTGKELTNSAENPAGNIVKFSITKLLYAAPDRRTGFYTLKYDIGIDYLADLLEVAELYGIVEKAGSWYRLFDTDSGDYLSEKVQGQNGVYNLLKNDTELLKRVEELVDKAIA